MTVTWKNPREGVNCGKEPIGKSSFKKERGKASDWKGRIHSLRNVSSLEKDENDEPWRTGKKKKGKQRLVQRIDERCQTGEEGGVRMTLGRVKGM